MIKVNGIEYDAAGKTLEEFLLSNGYDMKRTAVERNGEIVPRSQYSSTVLADGDCIEVVSFVGGG